MAARTPQQARSQSRRDALLKAAAELIAEGGVSAVTHRAVAARAGLPPSTAGYFFDSIDDLAAEALRMYTERAVADYLDLRQSALEGGADDIDRLIDAIVHRRAAPEENAAQVSLYLEADRSPKLRAAVSSALDAYWRFAEETLAAVGVPRADTASHAVVALFDGFMLHNLAQPEGSKRAGTFTEAVNAMLVGYLLDEHERRAVKARLRDAGSQQAV